LQVALSALGMGSPAGRFLGVSLISAGLLYLIKPSPFFDISGAARPWSVLTLGKPSQSGAAPTVVPFYLAALFAGFLAATFI
jgi:hypothetical protein